MLILMQWLVIAMCFDMLRFASLVVGLAVATLTAGVASPIAAQSPEQQQPPKQRIINVPGQGYVYLVPVPADDTRSVEHVVNVPGIGDVRVIPVRQKDTRIQRQRCVDEEVASEGGNPSVLAMRIIDLKCSQR